MSEADRIRLEERARLLSKISEDVSEMVGQLSETMSNESRGQKTAKTQKNQRGSKSLSNLSSSDTSKPKYTKKPQKKNTAGPNQAHQPNSFPPNPPSYNESIQQLNQIDFSSTPRFYSQPMVMNQPTIPFYPQTPGNIGQNYILPNPQQYQPQHGPQQQQYRPHQQQQQYRPHQQQQQYRPHQQQQRPHQQQQHYQPHQQQQQYRPRQQQQQFCPQQQQQQYRSQTQKQPEQQKSFKTSQFPTPLPRKSMQKANSATNVEKQTPSSHQDDKNLSKSSIDLNVLIRELSNFSGYYTDIANLSKIMDSNYNDVLKVIKWNSKIFSTLQDESQNKVFVELCPKIKICQDHIGSLGCTKPKCLALHICLDFINEKCQDAQNCSFGHIWKTDHNNSVLKEFFLALLPNKVLCSLMKKVFSDIIIPEICMDCPTNEGQTNDKCNKLHICHSYVNNLGNCSDGTNCAYNHNVRDAKCLEFFKHIGISSNESPRDLLKVIKDRCLVKKDCNVQNQGAVSKQKPVEKISRDDQSKNSVTSTKHKHDNTTTKPQFDQNKTICCYQFLGSVVEPKICIEGIDMKCKFSSSGCKYLHCRHKTHWQFGNENKWYNFHVYHSQILDTKYSDVNCDNVVLPKLNAKKVTGQQNALFSLMGNLKSKVDFKNMTIDCEGSKKIFSIRQLTTVSSVLSERSESTKFKWYFLENDGKWVSYGDGDSSSSIIEKAYLEQPSDTFNFKSKSFTYILDFAKMTQENLSTKKVRQIKRRPEIIQSNDDADKDKFQLPKHWEKSTDQEIYKMVMLSSANEEYTEIRQIIALSLPMIDIVNIYRIQNAHLWKQFQNKQTELGKKYNDTFLNIQKLFHGIEREHLSDICQVNLEFRLHDDSSIAKPYGEGTYFYNSAGVASSNCKVDFMGNKTLLVAEVIIGKVAQGNSGMTRPPPNSKYNFALYDTTTDKVESPSVFVKYNRQEYYPAYVVEFK